MDPGPTDKQPLADRGIARRGGGLLLALALLGGCAHAPPRNPMAQWVPSPNFNLRKPTLVVLHYTEQDSVEQSLDTLRTRNAGGRVSAHYLVGKDGRLFQLVAEQHRAWHAGAGSWGAIDDVNAASIGIELDNDGRSVFPDAQVATLLRLLADVTARHGIAAQQVIGHSDLAPARKIDPGALFPWQRLAAAGFGRWPDPAHPPPPAGFDVMLGLRALGYPLADPAAALRAFRLRYRPQAATDAPLDAEDARIAHALLAPAATGLAPAPAAVPPRP